MLHLKLAPDFELGAIRKWRLLAPVAESLRLRVFKGASTAAIGAFAGWGAVLVLGAVLMTDARRDRTPAAPESVPVAALAPVPVVAAAPVSAPAASTPVAAITKPQQAPAAAPTPAPTKVTQRVDMSPTAAIAEPPKPHHKPHKKKTKDLDSTN